MKRLYTAIFFTLVSCSLCANEEIKERAITPEIAVAEVVPHLRASTSLQKSAKNPANLTFREQSEKEGKKRGYFYFQMNAAKSFTGLATGSSVYPGLGIGYRVGGQSGTVDILFSGLGVQEGRGGRYQWNAPKISYFAPLKEYLSGVYLGPSLAWGGMAIKNEQGRQSFIGLIGGGTLGWNFFQDKNSLAFLECNISQPMFASQKDGPNFGPSLSISTGVGF
ncbi:MAG: hypothetical protein AAGI90_04780 [Chlamydiota bacterium]